MWLVAALQEGNNSNQRSLTLARCATRESKQNAMLKQFGLLLYEPNESKRWSVASSHIGHFNWNISSTFDCNYSHSVQRLAFQSIVCVFFRFVSSSCCKYVVIMRMVGIPSASPVQISSSATARELFSYAMAIMYCSQTVWHLCVCEFHHRCQSFVSFILRIIVWLTSWTTSVCLCVSALILCNQTFAFVFDGNFNCSLYIITISSTSPPNRTANNGNCHFRFHSICSEPRNVWMLKNWVGEVWILWRWILEPCATHNSFQLFYSFGIGMQIDNNM